jgi:hypothetical protein
MRIGKLGTQAERADDANRSLGYYRDYYYRRRLKLDDLLPAIGAGIGIGLLGFYVARLYLQKTPIELLGREQHQALVRRRVDEIERG